MAIVDRGGAHGRRQDPYGTETLGTFGIPLAEHLSLDLLRLFVADNSLERGVVRSFSPWRVRPSSRAWVFSTREQRRERLWGREQRGEGWREKRAERREKSESRIEKREGM